MNLRIIETWIIASILRFTFITTDFLRYAFHLFETVRHSFKKCRKSQKSTFGCLLELNILYTICWNFQAESPSVNGILIYKVSGWRFCRDYFLILHSLRIGVPMAFRNSTWTYSSHHKWPKIEFYFWRVCMENIWKWSSISCLVIES